MKKATILLVAIIGFIYIMGGCQDISKTPQKSSGENKPNILWDNSDTEDVSENDLEDSKDDKLSQKIEQANANAKIVSECTVSAVQKAFADNMKVEQGLYTGTGGIAKDYIERSNSIDEVIQIELGASFRGNWATVVNLSTGCTYALWSEKMDCETLKELPQLTKEKLEELKGDVGCYPVKK